MTLANDTGTAKNAAAVEVRDLTVKFGDFTAVDDVTFSVGRGEIFGFLGANGAGKTTTIRVLCGLLIPTAGHVSVAGLALDSPAGGEAVKRRVGYMSQRFTLYSDLTVDENLEFAARLRKMDPADAERRIEELFQFIHFDHPRSTLVGDLPGGFKQELSLVAALIHRPEIVFLDEPTAGVSPASRQRFWALIRRLASDGITVFVTTHYMDEAEECQRIALMRAGRIIALDSPKNLKSRTFTETLVELRMDDGSSGWMEALNREGALSDVQPYGLRYHGIVKDQKAFDRAAARFPALKWRPIAPSLEDVFVRLVEGADR
ncbi:MAG: ABC transporter ATP-binding protein [Elusimicrobia bacterium]|nr:ABC transporter ATP-binding protein [Elusimicrobiota bacterium]